MEVLLLAGLKFFGLDFSSFDFLVFYIWTLKKMIWKKW